MSSQRLLFFQAEDGIRDVERSRGLGDVYKRQGPKEVEAYVKDMQKKDFKALDELKAQGILK